MNKMAFNIMALSIITMSMMIKGLIRDPQIFSMNDTQHKNIAIMLSYCVLFIDMLSVIMLTVAFYHCYAECHAECRYSECFVRY